MNTKIYNYADSVCKETLSDILRYGTMDENPRPIYSDGTPAHTISINQVVHRYDLSRSQFPVITLRPLAVKSAIREILWIYQEQSNDLDVLKNKYKISWWDPWESKDIKGTIGVRYGETVRKHKLMDNLLDGLINDPFGRRHIISLWQNSDFEESDGLMPCAFLTMWNVRKDKNGVIYLDMTLIQRSCDYVTAGSINAVQYTALLMMVAAACGYKPGVFVHFIQNVQIYDRHIQAAKSMIERESISSPIMKLNVEDKVGFYDIKESDFEFVNFPVDHIKLQNPNFKLDLGI